MSLPFTIILKFLILAIGLTSLPRLIQAQAGPPAIGFRELCARLQLTTEYFAYDKNGMLLEKKRQFQRISWKKPWSAISEDKPCVMEFGMAPTWGNDTVPFTLMYRMEVKKDNKISLRVRQYGKTETIPPSKEDEVLLEKTFALESMSAILWESPIHKNPRLVARMTPNLTFKEEPKDIDKLDLAGRDVQAVDNYGRVWAQNIYFRSRYLAIKSHVGSVAISYYPFAGSKPIGEAKGRTITLFGDNTLLKIEGKHNFLPEGMTAKIYGIFSSRKAEAFGDGTWGTSANEEQFLKLLEKDYL